MKHYTINFSLVNITDHIISTSHLFSFKIDNFLMLLYIACTMYIINLFCPDTCDVNCEFEFQVKVHVDCLCPFSVKMSFS